MKYSIKFVFTFQLLCLFISVTGYADIRAGLFAGAVQDGLTAFTEIKKAAEENNLEAQAYLGDIYLMGVTGVLKNEAKSTAWYRKAAELGFPYAQHRLAKAYLLGRGVTIDKDVFLKWLRISANQGYYEAQNELGNIYYHGKDLPVDYVQAVDLYRKSAMQGDFYGQLNLGAMYINGNGVPKSLAKAHAWLSLAAEQGYQKAKNYRKIVEKKITSTELEEAAEIKASLQQSVPKEVDPFNMQKMLEEMFEIPPDSEKYKTIDLPSGANQRYQFKGFSVIPPAGDGWEPKGYFEFTASNFMVFEAFIGVSSAVSFNRERHKKIFFSKKSIGDDNAKVMQFHIEDRNITSEEEFLDYVKSLEYLRSVPRRKNYEPDLSIDRSHGAICIRHVGTADDWDPPGYIGVNIKYVIHGLECLHPYNPNVLVSISFNQRRREQYQDIGLESDQNINLFINSVIFTE